MYVCIDACMHTHAHAQYILCKICFSFVLKTTVSYQAKWVHAPCIQLVKVMIIIRGAMLLAAFAAATAGGLVITLMQYVVCVVRVTAR